MTKNNKRKIIKRQNILQLVLVLIIIALLNIIGSFIFTRFDLTTEKRYSLSDVTKEVLNELEDIVYIKVYLDGDFPAGFKRLQQETKEMLDEFRAYSDFVEYEFINPTEGKSNKEINFIYDELVGKGLSPTQLSVRTEDGTSQKLIFPGAIAAFGDRETAIQLLDNQMGTPPELALNNSIQSLEFKLINSIRKLTSKIKLSVGFLKGQKELDNIYIQDAAEALSEYYDVSEVTIDQKLKSLDEYDALIIAKPDSLFDEKDKFILDQFIMKGGKVLWLLDPVHASMDSLRTRSIAVAYPRNTNLDDMLFKYGVRINTDLLMDMQAVPIPIVTGMVGNQPQQSLLPWYYFPLIIPGSSNPIVKNLNGIKTQFISSIDTLGTPGIKKTILLETSKYTKKVNTPTQISLKILQEEPNMNSFSNGSLPVAVLLEGTFKSVFKSRIPAVITEDKEIDFRESSVPNKMIVISDGDIISNQIDNSRGRSMSLPLGYDKYTRQTFGNKDFILNAMNFLCDNSGIIEIRSRELKLRMLDKAKVKDGKTKWQLINTLLPVLLVLFFAILKYYFRKKTFTTKK